MLREYAHLVCACAEDLVNGLDNLFQTNMYAKASEDPALQQEIKRKYFPVAELEYDESAGEICVNKWRGKSFRITTGGTALDAVGAVWHVKGTQSRPWPDYTPESFLFTVTCLAENSYRITGNFISNRLFEEKFIYSELEADFSTGTAYTGFYDTITDAIVPRLTELMIQRIEHLETDWQKPWITDLAHGLPRNLRGTPYRAGNILLLFLSGIAGYQTPIFMTFRQAKEEGLNILMDSKSFRPIFGKSASATRRPAARSTSRSTASFRRRLSNSTRSFPSYAISQRGAFAIAPGTCLPVR